jgi:hypothetical protein
MTPGLSITEADPELVMLYQDLQGSQLSWSEVQALSDPILYWLAAHQERREDMKHDRWIKLSQNAWRARAVVEQRAAARASEALLAFQHGENKANRKWTLWTALIAALIGAGSALVTVVLTTEDPQPLPQPLIVRTVSPSASTTTAPPSTSTTTSAAPTPSTPVRR